MMHNMYNDNELKEKEDFLRHILRRHPEDLNLEMTKEGWVNTNDLIKASIIANKEISLEDIIIIMNETKTEYSFSDYACNYIRANYGHSLGLKLEEIVGSPMCPNQVLYHGTIMTRVKSILEKGILPRGRDHVFLTSDFKKACEYGMKNGIPAIVEINAQSTDIQTISFFHPCTHIWLAYYVPAKYISNVIEFQAEG